MAGTKREDLLQAALELFSKSGFQSTGIDSILEKAGVAKMTLYKHFSSKDELVLSALRRLDEDFRNRLISSKVTPG